MWGIWNSFYKHSGKILGLAGGVVATVLAAPVIKAIVATVMSASPIVQAGIAVVSLVAVVSVGVTVRKYNNSTELSKDPLTKAEDDIESVRTESSAKLEANLAAFKQKSEDLEIIEKERVAEINKLKEEKAAAEIQVNQLTTEKVAVVKQVSDLSGQLATVNINNQIKENKLKTALEKIANLEKEQTSLKSQCDKQVDEIKKLKLELQEAQKKIIFTGKNFADLEDAKRDIILLQGKLEAKDLESKNAKKELAEAKKELTLAREEIASKTGQLMSDRQKMAKLENSQNSLEAKAAAIVKELAENKVTIKDLTKDRDEAIANMIKYEQELIKAEETINEKDKNITDLTLKVCDAMQNQLKLTAQVSKQSEEVIALQTTLQQTEKSLRSLEVKAPVTPTVVQSVAELADNSTLPSSSKKCAADLLAVFEADEDISFDMDEKRTAFSK